MTDNTKQPTTYMLVGEDIDKPTRIKSLARLKDVVVLRASEYPDIKDAVAQIKGPANIIIDAHGTRHGYFGWGAGKPPSDSHASGINPDGVKVNDYSYSQLFANLPRSGIPSVTVTDCFGGLAETIQALKNAPAGTIVQTLSSGTNATDNLSSDKFNDMLAVTPHPTPATLYLQALSTFNPYTYQSRMSQTQDNSNPYLALPHIIGVGGPTPLAIDIDTQLRNLASAKTPPDLSQAINLVQQNFNSNNLAAQHASHTGDDLALLNMAVRIEHHDTTIGKTGDPLTDAYDLRAAYALTAAYLYTSGTMDKWIAEAPKFTAPDIEGPERMADAMMHQSSFPDPAAPLALLPHAVVPAASSKPDVTVDVATLPAKDSDALAFLNSKIAQACATLDKNSISLGMSSYGELFSTPITMACGKESQQR